MKMMSKTIGKGQIQNHKSKRRAHEIKSQNTMDSGYRVHVGTRQNLSIKQERTCIRNVLPSQYPFGNRLKDLISEKDLLSEEIKTGTHCT